MEKPLVSIIMATYNHADYIEDSLISVINQTWSNWECIIIDDGSKDKTRSIVKEYCDKDKRISYFYQKNSGVCVARNYGVSLSKGEYILPLDSDDKISEDYIKLAMKKFSVNPSLKLVYCDAYLFGDKNEFWNLPEFSLKTLGRQNVIFSSAIFLKDDFVKIGGYDVKLRQGLEDWELWINLLKNNGKVYKIPKVCFYYRIRKQSRNESITNNQFENIYKYISLKHSDFYIKEIASFPDLLRENHRLKKENMLLLKHQNRSILIKIYRKIRQKINF